MQKKMRAAVFVDYQNMHHKAIECGHDFQIQPYLDFLRERYSIRHSDVHIFMHVNFWEKMRKNAQRHLERNGNVHTSTRERVCVDTDPVDIKMERWIRSVIRQEGIEVIVVGSADKAFADLGTVAWHWKKEFHATPYAEPAGRYARHTSVVEPLIDSPGFKPFVRL